MCRYPRVEYRPRVPPFHNVLGWRGERHNNRMKNRRHHGQRILGTKLGRRKWRIGGRRRIEEEEKKTQDGVALKIKCTGSPAVNSPKLILLSIFRYSKGRQRRLDVQESFAICIASTWLLTKFLAKMWDGAKSRKSKKESGTPAGCCISRASHTHTHKTKK